MTFSVQTMTQRAICCGVFSEPVELQDGEGFDTGVTPWVPVFWRQVFDETSGDWLATEYSRDAEFTSLYTPAGDVLPSISVEENINLGSQVIKLSATPQGFNIPPIVNAAQIEMVGEDNNSYANYSYDGNPLSGAFHRLGNGQPLIVHGTNMTAFLAVLGQNSKPGALHVHYHYNPKPNDHG